MLAELSTRKMNRSPSSLVPSQPGRNSASIASAMSSSCRNSSRFCRSRCHRLLTCKSSIDRFHRYVLGTSSGCRSQLQEIQAQQSPAAREPTAPHCHGSQRIAKEIEHASQELRVAESRARSAVMNSFAEELCVVHSASARVPRIRCRSNHTSCFGKNCWRCAIVDCEIDFHQ